jgi:hypothetical protein
MIAKIKSHLKLALTKPRTAAQEAEYRGLPKAEPGYEWRLQGDKLTYSGTPQMEYHSKSGIFVRVSPVMDADGQPTERGIRWLAEKLNKTEEWVKNNYKGIHFEMLILHEHSAEIVSQHSASYRVYLTKQVVGGKVREPTLLSIVRDILTVSGRQADIEQAEQVLRGTVQSLLQGDATMQDLANRIRASNKAHWISELDELLEGTLAAKKPDLVKFSVTEQSGDVTDFTLALDAPLHNFKTLVYRIALERATSRGFRAIDFRSATSQRVLTPADVRTQPQTRTERQAKWRREQDARRRPAKTAGAGK